MVLFFPLIAAIPTTIAVSEGVASQQRENAGNSTSAAEEKAQMRKFNLECYCEGRGKRAREIHGRSIRLRSGKLWISCPAVPSGHPFEGFYIPYPDPTLPAPPPLGLVSSIALDPPMLNWIYIDRSTRELKYGNRTQSREHVIGPWGWEAGEEGGAGGLTCGGIEGAVAVWKDGDDGGWELRWEDDDVEGKGVEGAMRVSLERRWIDAEEEEEEEEKEESEDVTEGKECGMGEGTKKKTETTFELRQKTVPRKSKKKSKAIAMTSNSVTQPVQK